MAAGLLVIGTRRYSSWSLRGWLAVRLAGLDVEERVIPLAGGASPGIKEATPAGLVPYLEHDGARVWESLSICEYCAELAPGLWPKDRVHRAAARSAAAEMHAGFRALRVAMPMNLGRERKLKEVSLEVENDIGRIQTIWREALREGTPFLYNERFGMVDAMYAPVVARLLSYQPHLSPEALAYCRRVRAHELMEEWYRLAAAEPAAWQLDHYESVA